MTRLATRLGLLPLLVACNAPAPPAHNLYLATVDYWPERQLLFLASPGSGIVDVMRVPSSPRQGSLDFVERLTDPMRHEVLRLSVDRARGRLWVADRRIVYVYELEPRKLAARVPMYAHQAPPISDLALDSEGNAYVLLGGGSFVYRVSSASLQLEKWLETAHRSPEKAASGRGRALLTKDSRYLLFQAPADGRLLRVDVQSRRVEAVQRTMPVDLDCGALFWKDDALVASLTAFHCRGRWIGEIKLDPQLRRSTERLLNPGQ